MRSIERVAAMLESFTGQGLTGKRPVWRLKGSSRRLEQFRSEVLQAICEEAQPFVHYEEAPQDLPAGQVAPNVWRLPVGTAGKPVLDWLYMGNWQLYLRAGPLESLRDLCRASDEDVAAFLDETETSIVIDSFHDDVEWVVGIKHDA